MRCLSRHWLQVFTHALLLILLAGCSIFQAPTTTPEIPLSQEEKTKVWQDHLNSTAQIKSWLSAGKIAFRVPDDSATLSFRWARDHDHFHMQLTGPLGQGGAIIWKDKDRTTLKTADKTTHAADTDNLIYTQLGWQLPVKALRYWVRGIPSPHSPSFKHFGSNGLLEKLSQDGWLIHYLRYNIIDGSLLPEKVRLQYGNLSITIIIKTWQLNPAINWSDYKLNK